jgi:starvation-inducible outer membrane lipoprotein
LARTPLPTLLGIAILLAGCSTPPVLLNGSDQGVVVRYSQSSGSVTEAVAAAEKFCAQYGRKAVQGEGDASTGDTFVSFSCEKP